MSNFWESIPGPVRTIINVVGGAAVAAGITYVVSHITDGNVDPNALVKVVLIAAGTALIRALNPADTTYGIGASPFAPVPPAVGEQDAYAG
jgi:hypothetical protein